MDKGEKIVFEDRQSILTKIILICLMIYFIYMSITVNRFFILFLVVAFLNFIDALIGKKMKIIIEEDKLTRKSASSSKTYDMLKISKIERYNHYRSNELLFYFEGEEKPYSLNYYDLSNEESSLEHYLKVRFRDKFINIEKVSLRKFLKIGK